MHLRHFINLVESKSNARTLYRGDATQIDEFSTEKSRHSIGLLFGLGIYLTDNPRVALDYTVKGGWKPNGEGTVLLRTDAPTQQEAVRQYLLQIINKRLGWPEIREAAKGRALQELYRVRLPRPETPRWRDDGSVAPEHEDWEKANRKLQDKLQGNFEKIARAEFSKCLAQAKAIFRKEKEHLRVFEDTMGMWVIMRASHGGTITTFEIPENYLAKTIHGDVALEGKAFDFVRDFINTVTEGRICDLRNYDGDQRYAFDDWVKLFREEGSRYAWREQHIGGEGKNPSLDEIWNGTHAGTSIFYNHIDKFIDAAKKAGFVGIEYDGGVRVGNQVRGQGGIRHQAFVFWDDKFINSCRVEQNAATYHPANTDALRAIRRASMDGDMWQKNFDD